MSQFNEWSEALERALAEPFPADWVQDKTMGGRKIAFVPWYRYAQRLNDVVGPQGWEIPEPRMHVVGSRVVMFVGLSVLGVAKWDVGEEHHEVVDKETGEMEEFNGYGGPSLNAYAQGMKRAAAKFGLGLYLYDKKGAGKDPRRAAPPERADSKDCLRLAALVEEIEALPKKLNEANEQAKQNAAQLAVNGGTRIHVAEAIAWADNILKHARKAAVA